MRGAFDTTCDVYYGYESPYGAPGSKYVTAQPCRVVPQLEVDQQDFPVVLTDKWLTTEALNLNTPKFRSLAFGQWWANVWTADMVAVPSGAPPVWSLIREEFMHGPAQGPYWRYELLPLASLVPLSWLPPDPPFDVNYGLTCASAAQFILGASVAFGIGPGMSHWYQFASVFGGHYTATVAGTAGATFRTDVFSGVCPGLFPNAGPMFGNGALGWVSFFGGQTYVRVQSSVPDTYTLTVTFP